MQEGFQRSVLPLYIKQTAIKRLPLPTKQSSNTVYVQNPNQPIPLWTYFQESLVFYILLYKQGEGGGDGRKNVDIYGVYRELLLETIISCSVTVTFCIIVLNCTQQCAVGTTAMNHVLREGSQI